MEVVRRVLDGAELANVIPLPVSFRSGKVEVIVLQVAERTFLPKYSDKELDEMLNGSITQSLIGAIPIPDISLRAVKEERLAKYESVD